MPIQIIRNDITKMNVDAIVNTANRFLGIGGGVTGAIHKAAGPELLTACQKLGGCETGEVKITKGYNLPCNYIIHTVGPVWRGGNNGEEELLRACYRRSLRLAVNNGCQSIAFPLISTGTFGYPKEKAFKVAMDEISSFLLKNDEDDLMVYLLVFSKESVQIGSKLFCNIERFIDDHYVEEHTDWCRRSERHMRNLESEHCMKEALPIEIPECSEFKIAGGVAPKRSAPKAAPISAQMMSKKSLEEQLKLIDESFSEMVIRKIAEKGMKNSECYKKANLDKKLFSKLYNDSHYKPKKQTALALAIALELDINETKELLMKAGLALSHSEKFDIIVEYFISNRKYNIFEINEALFYYDQPLLGSTMN